MAFSCSLLHTQQVSASGWRRRLWQRALRRSTARG